MSQLFHSLPDDERAKLLDLYRQWADAGCPELPDDMNPTAYGLLLYLASRKPAKWAQADLNRHNEEKKSA